MKKLIALLLALILIMIPALTTSSGESLATPTNLDPIDPPAEPEEPDIPEEPEDTGPPIYDFSPSLSNLNNFSIVALNNFNMQGHIRNSIWVGGTLTGESWMCVDDGSVSGAGAHDSYVYNNQGGVQFKARTSEQSADAYRQLSEAAATNASNYWWSVYYSLGDNGETCIYVPAAEDGVAYIHGGNIYPRYICEGSDESEQSSNVTYWTDASSVSVMDICGFIIAPGSTINLQGNNRVSVVGYNVNVNWAEIHINGGTPTIVGPTPTPTETETET